MDADDAVRLRRAINQLSRKLNTAATDEGLTPTQASVLGLVVGFGPMTAGALLRHEHINPTMLSRVIGRLEEDGLVIRRPDPDDLRSATIEATDSGRAVNARVKQLRADAVAAGASELSPRELAQLLAAIPALERLAAKID
jgi:DNA-binding MarR family transcriptional regulator